jgi:transcriptional regulator GlxA family with amidase domain
MSKARHDRSTFGVVVYDGVEPIDVGATVGVLSMAKRVLPNLAMHIVAKEPGLVTLASGLRMIADFGFADCPPVDVMVVCGGPGWKAQARTAATLAFLRKPQDGILASVCTGAMILAAAGVLDGKSATTRRLAVGDEEAAPLSVLRREHPKVDTRDALIVDADQVVTGGGVSLAIDTMLYLLERLYGKDTAAEIAEVIEYTAAWRANAAAFQSRGVVRGA